MGMHVLNKKKQILDEEVDKRKKRLTKYNKLWNAETDKIDQEYMLLVIEEFQNDGHSDARDKQNEYQSWDDTDES